MTPQPAYIDVEVLAKAVTLALEDFAKLYGSKRVVEKNHFWAVMPDQDFNLDTQPTRHSLGQVSWAFDELNGVAQGEKQPSLNDLVWAADVLRALGLGRTGSGG